jgi:hypothetical protein
VGLGVSWRIAAASHVGTSHAATGAACQDAAWANVIVRPEGGDLLAVFVADGAGSAAMGGVGAAEAVAAAAAFTAALTGPVEFDAAFADRLLGAVRTRIAEVAALEGAALRDYATTFQAVLIGEAGTFVAQVGDGAIVIDVGDGLALVPPPPGGEYVNQTTFVTEERAHAAMAVRTFPRPAIRVASLSDGLNRLALDLASSRPHEPFFAPLFATLARADVERAALEAALQRFLGGASVAERTDDDVTLALAIRLP